MSQQEIFTALSAARSLIEREKLKPYLMVEKETMEDFEGITSTTENPDAVVVGLAPSLFNYENMNEAFRSELFYILKI